MGGGNSKEEEMPEEQISLSLRVFCQTKNCCKEKKKKRKKLALKEPL